MIAMGCARILMKPGTSIGAAMVVEHGGGVTDKAAPKFQAAYAAMGRALAETNGHPPAVAEAMVLTDMTLYVVPVEDGFRFCNDADFLALTAVEKGKSEVVKARGKILVLTADECARYGLAIIVNRQDLAGVLGITNRQQETYLVGKWRAAVASAGRARQGFLEAQQVASDVQAQRTAIAEYLNRVDSSLNRDYFTTAANMLDTLAGKCVMLQTVAGTSPTLSAAVQAAAVLRKRAAAASQLTKNTIAQDLSQGVATTYRASDDARLRRQIEDAKVEEERELARWRDQELAANQRDLIRGGYSHVNPLTAPGAQARMKRGQAEALLEHRQMRREQDEEQRARYVTLHAQLLREFGRSAP
jgi:hypothetical protein